MNDNPPGGDSDYETITNACVFVLNFDHYKYEQGSHIKLDIE